MMDARDSKRGFLFLHDHEVDTIVWQDKGNIWLDKGKCLLYICTLTCIDISRNGFVPTHHLWPISIYHTTHLANSRREISRAITWNLPTPSTDLGKPVILPFCWEELRANAASKPRAWLILVAQDMHETWLFSISALFSFFSGTIFTDESALCAPVTFATVASSGFWEFWVAFQTDADCSFGCFVNLLDVVYGPLLKFGLLSTQTVAAPR